MTKRLDRYVDAIRALRALEAAEKDEGRTPARDRAIADARYLVNSYALDLSSRELWLADRLLNAREVVTA